MGHGTATTVGAALTLWPGQPGHAVNVAFQEGNLTTADFRVQISLTQTGEGHAA